jgi:hypothetical protein
MIYMLYERPSFWNLFTITVKTCAALINVSRRSVCMRTFVVQLKIVFWVSVLVYCTVVQAFESPIGLAKFVARPQAMRYRAISGARKRFGSKTTCVRRALYHMARHGPRLQYRAAATICCLCQTTSINATTRLLSSYMLVKAKLLALSVGY